MIKNSINNRKIICTTLFLLLALSIALCAMLVPAESAGAYVSSNLVAQSTLENWTNNDLLQNRSDGKTIHDYAEQVNVRGTEELTLTIGD